MFTISRQCFCSTLMSAVFRKELLIMAPSRQVLQLLMQSSPHLLISSAEWAVVKHSTSLFNLRSREMISGTWTIPVNTLMGALGSSTVQGNSGCKDNSHSSLYFDQPPISFDTEVQSLPLDWLDLGQGNASL